ncbi:MAG: hypothetical protein KatS3mg058_2754 [Roseiflexus sp.]|nr:MAG: hypothetical protein KatS3mg058_2754 [Roseiflexus sp.]
MAGSARRGSVRPSTLRLRGAGGGGAGAARGCVPQRVCRCARSLRDRRSRSKQSPSSLPRFRLRGAGGRAPRAGASRSGYADVRGHCATGAAGRSNPPHPCPASACGGRGGGRRARVRPAAGMPMCAVLARPAQPVEAIPFTPCPAPPLRGAGGGGRRARVRPTVGAAGSAQGFGPSLKPCRDGYRCMSGAHAGNAMATTIALWVDAPGDADHTHRRRATGNTDPSRRAPTVATSQGHGRDAPQ